jgi:hypothetical protein
MRFPISKFEKRRKRFERGGTRARTLRPCPSSDSKASQTPAQSQWTQAEYECGGSKQDRGTPTKSLMSLMAAKSVPKKQQYNTPIRPANVIYLYLSWFMILISRNSVSIIPISYNIWISIQIIGYIITIIIDTILSASNLRKVAHKCYCDGYLGMHTSDATCCQKQVLEEALVLAEGSVLNANTCERSYRISNKIIYI